MLGKWIFLVFELFRLLTKLPNNIITIICSHLFHKSFWIVFFFPSQLLIPFLEKNKTVVIALVISKNY